MSSNKVDLSRTQMVGRPWQSRHPQHRHNRRTRLGAPLQRLWLPRSIGHVVFFGRSTRHCCTRADATSKHAPFFQFFWHFVGDGYRALAHVRPRPWSDRRGIWALPALYGRRPSPRGHNSVHGHGRCRVGDRTTPRDRPCACHGRGLLVRASARRSR